MQVYFFDKVVYHLGDCEIFPNFAGQTIKHSKMTLFRKAVALMFAVAATASVAQQKEEVPWDEPDEHLLNFNVEARVDWQHVNTDSHTVDSKSGFYGKYIAFKAQGTIMPGLSYTWRQRFSRPLKDGSFWDQTDILDLTYQTGKWDFGAGKQVVAIGGYEYNRAPIDLMCPTLFVANVACYQFGVSAGYRISAQDHLTFQISQSLFANAMNRNLYAYNLMWSGSRAIGDRLRFENIWSVNEIEYDKGHYCNYVALGNKLRIDDRFTVLIDLTTRTYPDNNIFKNNTFMGEFSWDYSPKLRLTGKVQYECNRGVNMTTATEIARGTQLTTGGVVAEWFPVSTTRHLLRIHAGCFYSGGDNHNPDELMQGKTFFASLGLTWHMNLLKIK